MTTSVLIANRGEVAVRVLRAAAESGMRSVAVYSEDDEGAMHQRAADASVPLGGVGPAAYLDAGAVVAAALQTGCTLLHPGWGFLSEQPELARRCQDAGIGFVGPTPETLEVLGDKVRARGLATSLGLPVLTSTGGATTLEEAAELLAAAAPGRGIMLKAVAGGGGRGIRAVTEPGALAAAYRDCQAEASAAFGDGRLFAEMYLPLCRHLEVQVVGDGSGRVAVVGDRDCSIQRSWQKLIEIAPAPALPTGVREELWDAARRLAGAVAYRGVGTFEFLLDVADGSWWFMEANPRLQVEHTVTEEVSGIDLVRAQLDIATGSSLAALGLDTASPEQVGTAVQLRLNAERMTVSGAVLPSAGVVTHLALPRGRGVRVDTAVASGDTVSPRFDSLLAKIIIHVPEDGLEVVAARALEVLEEIAVEGVDTNRNLLWALLSDPGFAAADLSTAFVPRLLEALTSSRMDPDADAVPGVGPVLVLAETPGVVTRLDVSAGQFVAKGDDLVHVEAMKMQHVTVAPAAGRIARVAVDVGEDCRPGMVLVEIDAGAEAGDEEVAASDGRTDDAGGSAGRAVGPSAELREVWARHALALDPGRPEVTAARHAVGKRTVRQQLADLFDEGTFVEYGSLAVASRQWRDTEEDLARRTPADGVVTGIGRVNGEVLGHDHSRPTGHTAVVAYDPTVMAGTQGHIGTQKTERLLHLAERGRHPVVLLADGGGGRPGDDAPGTFSPPLEIFRQFARLSGEVPLIGAAAGPCFGGNAALLACCDVVVATQDASIGMAGPVVVEAGGLGSFPASEIGPAPQLHAAGLVDVLADDDVTAVAAVRRTLAYFQGRSATWECPDQEGLREVLPRDRMRAYDVDEVIALLADVGSVQPLKSAYGRSMTTALARIEGAAVGFVANNPKYGAGAIDAEGGDKAARFARLCDSFGIPIVFLCDTPGFAVGPAAEASGQLRRFADLLVAGARLAVPFATVVLRKAYGLGAVAMCGGSFRAPDLVVAWPSAEFAGMAPEASVRLSAAKDLRAIEDPEARRQEFERRVASARESTAAIRAASRFRVDDVIDPAATREWIRLTLLDRRPD